MVECRGVAVHEVHGGQLPDVVVHVDHVPRTQGSQHLLMVWIGVDEMEWMQVDVECGMYSRKE